MTTVAPTMPVVRQEGAHHHHRHRQPARQGAEHPRHGGEQILRDARAFQRDPHQHEHGDRQQGFDRLAGQHPLVHAVDDEGECAEEGALGAAFEQRRGIGGQIGIAEQGDGVLADAAFHQGAIGVAAVVDGLAHQPAGIAQQRQDGEGGQRRATDGEGHRIAGENAGEQAGEDDQKADFDPVQPHRRPPKPYRWMAGRAAGRWPGPRPDP